MSYVAVYRFDETGAGSRAGQLGTEDAFTTSSGTVAEAAGLLGNGLTSSTATGAMNNLALAGPVKSALTLTVGVWVKHTSLAAATRFRLTNSVGGQYFWLVVPATTGTYGVRVVDDSGINSLLSSGVSASFGVWNHLAYSWNNSTSTLKIYINGALAATHVLTIASGFSVNFQLTGNWDQQDITLRNNLVYDQLLITNAEEPLATFQQWYNGGAGYDPTAVAPASTGRRRNRRRMTAG